MSVKEANKKDENKKNNKEKKPFSRLLLTNLFGGKKKQDSLLVEDDIQTPWQTVWATFKDNKVSMTALIVFLTIFATVLIGPLVHPIDLSFSEVSQKDVAPNRDFLKVPKELQGKIQQISTGPTYSLGLSTDGKLYIWGVSKVTIGIDLRRVPANMGKIEKIAAGYDHALALNDKGELFAWGNNRQKQASLPEQKIPNIKDIYAGYQNSIILTEDGHVHYFGNTMNNDYYEFNEYQGQIDKLALTSDAVLGLTFDGDVVYLGTEHNSYTNIPENMGNVVDIAATAGTVAAVNDEGQVFVWGNVSSKGEGRVPETESKIVELQGGRYHYTALTEDNHIVSWGGDYYKQSIVPKKVQDLKIDRFYTGFYQNFAIDTEGNVHTWGLKGYLFGTDELGRDIFTRLLNGGRMSMTIGAVAVIISTIIGIIVGSVSGFLGGKVDIVLQRISEMVASLPFLPFAMILSALIGNALTSRQRIVLIMAILGLLSWTGLQRLVRAQVLSVREQEYVIAARALGVKQRHIVFKHILPNVISVIIVSATLSFASSMLTEATLSYLGFGVQAPIPTWGNMLYGANNSIVIQNFWWRWVFASIVLGVSVICINLIGDGLRDAIDPKSQER